MESKTISWVVPIGQMWAHAKGTNGQSVCGRYGEWYMSAGDIDRSGPECHACRSLVDQGYRSNREVERDARRR